MEVVDGEYSPIASAQISIYDNQTLVFSELTEEDGSYSFTLEAGTYVITVEDRKYITKSAFVVVKSGSSFQIDFYLEPADELYQVFIFLEDLPPEIFPEMRVDGSFFGHVYSGIPLSFEEGTSHLIELNRIVGEQNRYIPTEEKFFVREPENITFRYIHQFYIDSNAQPWINAWYTEGSVIHLEARDTINLGNMTRLILQGWLKDESFLGENPLNLTVKDSYRVEPIYSRQYYLRLSTERSVPEGEGWYDEGALPWISVEDIEVGALPLKYRFKAWRGDIESPNATTQVFMNSPKVIYAEWERVEVAEIEELDPIYKAIISIGILVFAATILSSVFRKVRLPEVLGELFAGMILGPYAFGGLMIFGNPLIELNEYVTVFAEVGAILLLFIAGLEISFGHFKAVGAKSSVVGILGVVVPFFLGIYVMQRLGFDWNVGLLVAATLTATSIAITLRTLENMHRLHSTEGGIMINAAVIDDVLGLVVLAVVLSIVTSGVAPLFFDVVWILARTVAFWLLLLAVVLIIAPRAVGVAERWRSRGTVEMFATALCFGSSVSAALIGLSPIVGAFAAGMALASSKVLARVRDYIDKLSLLFGPIFFAYVGAQFNIRALSFDGIWIIIVLIGIAILSKLVGCGLPAMAVMRSSQKGLRVGIGMISRGEVGLIIAGIGVTSGILSQSLYGAVVTMVIVTTVITPIALKLSYTREVTSARKE
ncbi:cation:proton antiporter domain-containing protein [[Eubacterium] cellulosolvens]